MKKAKEKHQLVSEPNTAAGEIKISSIALALQQFKREAEKNRAAEETAKSRCPVCFKEIAPKRLCSGHGGGSGENNSATADKASNENVNPNQSNSLTQPRKVVGTEDELIGNFGSEKFELELSFDPKVIANLITKGLLLVNSDRKSLTLNIQLQCEPNKLTEEQRKELKKFMEAITETFNKFKEENHLSNDCMQIIQDKQENISSLRINMPTLALYDAFIQRLANNLVPIPSLKSQEKNEAIKDQTLVPNPLSTEPKLSKDKSSIQENIERKEVTEELHKTSESEKLEVFSPSPFNMKPW